MKTPHPNKNGGSHNYINFCGAIYKNEVVKPCMHASRTMWYISGQNLVLLSLLAQRLQSVVNHDTACCNARY